MLQKDTKTTMALTLGMTKRVLILAPKSNGWMNFIYVGKQNTGPLLEAYSCGINAKITKVEFWLVNEAKKGWIRVNSLHMDYWNGSWMTQGYAMKNEMSWEEFMAWWAPKQLAIELDYWTLDPSEPPHASMIRCLP